MRTRRPRPQPPPARQVGAGPLRDGSDVRPAESGARVGTGAAMTPPVVWTVASWPLTAPSAQGLSEPGSFQRRETRALLRGRDVPARSSRVHSPPAPLTGLRPAGTGALRS